ncbi:MAG: LacI family DNA-binding transcriptional regulator [Chloroflexota bacterium]|nr:LacI family DNA-binding transcriptional regulator [Chloroflexota bacterium]
MSLSTDEKKRSRATIDDVAKLAGVSNATVSRVFNRTNLVTPKTTERVRAAIIKLNYRPQAAAQVLANQKSNTIGLLLSEIGGDFFTPMLRGIESQANAAGYGLLIYATQKERLLSSPLGEHNTDGLLVFVDSLADSELARFKQIGFPVVLIHRSSPPGLQIPSVTIENKNGTRRLMAHLIEVHHYRRIAFLTGQEGHEDAQRRELGYREALAAHNIPFDPQLVAPGQFNREIAQTSAETWLRDGVEFEALFTCDDEAAIGVLAAYKRAGVRVPEDVAVVGFDDINLMRYITPALTTVRAPVELVGKTATQQLVRLIAGEELAGVTLLPTELIIRRSCGCSP